MLSAARVVLASAVLSSCILAAACGDDEKGDPSTRIRVSALATEASTLEGPEGSSLLIPAGASETDVTIVLSAPRTRRSAPAGTTVVSGQFTLAPEGKTFVQGLELSIPITPSAIPAGKTIDDVVVIRAPQGTGTDAFVPVPTRREGSAVVGTTEHFSDFLAVVIDDEATPFGSCGDSVCLAAESCDVCPFDCNVCLPSSDTVPPVVSALVSPSATTGVAGNVVVQVQFDGALLANSVSPESFRLVDAAQTVVAGTFTVGATGLVEFRPTATLAQSTTYTLTIVGLRDAAGNLMIAPYSATFTTGVGAAVSVTVPIGGATSVPQSDPIAVVFDAAVARATVTAQPDDGPCTGTFQVSTDDFATCVGGTMTFGTGDLDLSFLPIYPLLGDATAKARFAPGALSANGFQLVFATPYAFGVETDVTAPVLTSMTPASGSTGVPIDIQEIVLRFSEPIDPASLNGDGLLDGSEDGSVDCDLTFAGGVVTCRPVTPLRYAATYSIYVFGVRDRANNASNDDGYYELTTVSQPYIFETAPADLAVGVHPRADIEIQFSEPMDETTFVMQAANGPCTGTIRLREASNTTTCYGGTFVALGSDRYAIRATSSYPLGTTMLFSTDPSLRSLGGVTIDFLVEKTFVVSPVNEWAYALEVHTYPYPLVWGAADGDTICTRPGFEGKALMLSSSRHPCTSSWCGLDVATPTVNAVDWVLETNRTYVRQGDGVTVFRTDVAAPIPQYPGTLTNPISTTPGTFSLFGGTADWLVDLAANCSNFGSNSVSALVSRSDLTSTAAIWPVAAGTLTCDVQDQNFVCVEQLGGTSRATH